MSIGLGLTMRAVDALCDTEEFWEFYSGLWNRRVLYRYHRPSRCIMGEILSWQGMTVKVKFDDGHIGEYSAESFELI